MRIIITNSLTLRDIPSGLETELVDRLTFKNPKWEENEKYGYWQGDTPRFLRFYDELEGEALALPRGFIRLLIGLCRRHGITYRIEDNRRLLPEVDFSFQGRLRPYQEEAVKAILKRDFGTLPAPTGSGKTVKGLYVIAKRKQPTIILTHTKNLLYQWKDQTQTFLGIPQSEIGQIGDGKKFIGERITVALVQSLYKIAKDVSPQIGHLIVDECHRAPSRTFTEAVSAFDCKYMLGLSATLFRRDGLSRLIFWHIGDVVHEVEKKDLIKTGDVLEAEVIWRKTNYDTGLDPSTEYSTMVSELTQNPARNALIVRDIAKESRKNNGICLVLSDRKSHCRALCEGLDVEHGIYADLLTGDTPKKDREDIVKRLSSGKAQILVATGQLVGEGFDCKALSTLFLATPIKFDGRVIQYLGRVLRPAKGKRKARVYDYVDLNVGVLKASAKARRRVYG